MGSFEKAGLTLVLVWLILIIGWIMNTWKCIAGFLDANNIAEVATVHWVQLLGIFTGPVGSIMGLFIW
ncbi:hypothetical protein D3C80_1609730 [compost metagenome]